MIDNKLYDLLGLARRVGKISFGTESAKETIEKHKAKLVAIEQRKISNWYVRMMIYQLECSEQ